MEWLQIAVSSEEKQIIREEAEIDRRTMTSLVLSIVMDELARRRRERRAEAPPQGVTRKNAEFASTE